MCICLFFFLGQANTNHEHLTYPSHSRLLSLEMDEEHVSSLSTEDRYRKQNPQTFSTPRKYPNLPDIYIINGHKSTMTSRATISRPFPSLESNVLRSISIAEWASAKVGGNVVSVPAVDKEDIEKRLLWEEPPPVAPAPIIPLYWIGLKDATRRAKHMRDQCRRLGWAQDLCIHVAGVDGRSGCDVFRMMLDKNYDYGMQRALPRSSVDCAALAASLAHYSAIRTAYIDGHEMALIAEDDADLSLYDESVLIDVVESLNSQNYTAGKWSYLQLTYLQPHILEKMFSYENMSAVPLYNKVPSGFALNLYSRKGMAEILDVVGYNGTFRIPEYMNPKQLIHLERKLKSPWNYTPRTTRKVKLSYLPDFAIPNMVELPMIATRPLAYVRSFSSQIDSQDTKGFALDAAILAHSYQLPGAAIRTHYGKLGEISRTAAHIKAIKLAYDAGLSRVVILDNEGFGLDLISWGQVELAIEAAETEFYKEESENFRDRLGAVLQLMVDDPVLWITEHKASMRDQKKRLVVARRREMRGANFYVLFGRKVMNSFAQLLSGDTDHIRVEQTIRIPRKQPFIIDTMLYQRYNVAAYFAPRAMKGPLLKPNWFEQYIGENSDMIHALSLSRPLANAYIARYFSGADIARRLSGSGSSSGSGSDCSSEGARRLTGEHWCNAGKHWPGTNTINQCVNCPAGYYKACSGVAGCSVCEAGYYTSSPGQTSCLKCAEGKYMPTNWGGEGKLCITCLSGGRGFVPNGIRNEPLPSDTDCASSEDTACYCLVENSEDCAPAYCPGQCAPGSYDINEVAFCNLCPDANNAAVIKCNSCPLGWYSSGVGICQSCEEGKYSNNALTDCIACSAGFWSNISNASNNGTCTACVAGKYLQFSGGSSEISCEECGAGTFMIEDGADHESKCIKCPLGMVSHPNNTEAGALRTRPCVSCPRGRFMDEMGYTGEGNISEVKCKDCVAGHKAANVNMKACVQCQPGTYQNVTGSYVCEACIAGLFQDSVGMPNCSSCHAGYSTNNQSNMAICIACAKGMYSDTEASSTCKRCTKGKYQDQTSSSNLGVYITECKICIAGMVSPSDGLALCVKCEPGKYVAVIGADICEQCFKGQYRSSSNQNATVCSDCPAGYHQSEMGEASCLACLPGQYADQDGQPLCKSCTVGKFRDDLGGVQCYNVEEGYIAAAGRSTQRQVAQGYKAIDCEGGGRSTKACNSVEACPAGKRGKATATRECQQCPVGWTSYPAAMKCNQCDKGKYGIVDSGDLAVCADCPAGFYQEAISKNLCVMCPLGWEQTNVGSQACVDMGVLSPENCVPQTEYLDMSYSCAEDDFNCMKENYRCLPCPRGAACEKNSDHTNTRARYGFWRADSISDPRFKMKGTKPPFSLMQSCPFPKRCNNIKGCLNITSSNVSTGTERDQNATRVTPQCCPGVNIEYPLCAVCLVGWTKSSTGDCTKCTTSTQSSKTTTLLVVFAFVIVLSLILKRVMKKHKAIIRTLFLDILRVVAVMINFTQISTSVTSTIQVQWPDNFLIYLNVFRFVNLDFLDLTGFACSVVVSQRSKVTFACVVVTLLFSASVLSYIMLRIKLATQLGALSGAEKSTELLRLWKNALRKTFEIVDEDASGMLDAGELSLVLKVIQTKTELDTNAHKLSKQMESNKADVIAEVKSWDVAPAQHSPKKINSRAQSLKDFAFGSKKNTEKAKALAKRLMFKWKKDESASLSESEFLDMFESENNLSKISSMVALVKWQQSSAIASQVFGTIGQIAFVLHAPISRTLFQWFDCRYIGSRAFVKTDFSTECGTPDYVAVSVLAAAFIMGFSIGLPVAVTAFFLVKRDKLHSPKTLAAAGWLYNRYNKGVEWWEIHELSRKLILCSAIIFVPDQLRVPFAILISLTAMSILNRFHPQKNNLVFKVAMIAFSATCVKFISAVILRAAKAEGNTELIQQVGAFLVVQDIFIYIFSLIAVALLAKFLLHKVDRAHAAKATQPKNQSVIMPTSVADREKS